MMQKPEITKKLAWIAFWLEIGWIVVNIILIFLACVLPAGTAPEYVRKTEIPLSIPALSAVGYCCMIPFAWSCLRSALQKEISANRAESGIALPAVLYFVGIVLNWLLNTGKSILAVRFYSTEVAGAFSIRTQYQSLLGLLPVQTASLVLICCASAVELYIIKHKES